MFVLGTLGANTRPWGVVVKLGLGGLFKLGLVEFKPLFAALPVPSCNLLFGAVLPTLGAKLLPGLGAIPLLNLVVVLLDELTTPGARVASKLPVGLGKAVVGAKGLAVTGSGLSLGTGLTVVRLGWRCESAIVLITALAPTIPAKAAIFWRELRLLIE